MMYTSHLLKDRRMTILRTGILQLILAFLAMLLLSRCSSPQNAESASEETTVAAADSMQQVHLVDTDYVHIAMHHPEETKQILKELENRGFEEGTLGFQLLDYLKKGDNDFGDEFKFIDLQFINRTADINPRFNKEIDDLVLLMQKFPNLKIKLMAYTDNVGEESANEKLSEDRNKAIIRELKNKGISSERIESKAFGEKYPVGDNKILEGRLINNRIELMVLSK